MVTLQAAAPGASTTYLTGSFTAVVRHAVLDAHGLAASRGGVSRLAGLLAGAAGGAALLRVTPASAPALAAALVTGVALAVAYRTRHPR